MPGRGRPNTRLRSSSEPRPGHLDKAPLLGTGVRGNRCHRRCRLAQIRRRQTDTPHHTAPERVAWAGAP